MPIFIRQDAALSLPRSLNTSSLSLKKYYRPNRTIISPLFLLKYRLSIAGLALPLQLIYNHIMGNTEFPSQFTEKEIQKLYARFKQIDEDNSGDLDPDEIFNVPELNQNPLVKRVISIFDKNKDGKISFS